ncbi:86ac0008-b190-4b58-a9b6-33460a124881 [Thermothielavioides terrestris]|uniref:86ac0008-b190-4b58-a9b6-33460a124881 n=1 Tax=Thermothielavioides terrestris TaxID=2587410 RepID=A0A3S4F2R5_9PEZI|nr:86ac0008-b190-4b58-a9b6-33460a124881 [Thermothielavioides terrestris]
MAATIHDAASASLIDTDAETASPTLSCDLTSPAQGDWASPRPESPPSHPKATPMSTAPSPRSFWDSYRALRAVNALPAGALIVYVLREGEGCVSSGTVGNLDVKDGQGPDEEEGW